MHSNLARKTSSIAARSMAAILVCLFLAGPAWAASSGDNDTPARRLKGWNISEWKETGGCYFEAPFEGELVLSVGTYAKGEQSGYMFTIHSKNWTSLENRQHYPITIQLGDHNPWEVNAMASVAKPIYMLGSLTRSEKFMDQLKSSDVLRISYDNKIVARLELKGVSGAMADVLECQKYMQPSPPKSSQ